MAHCRMLSGCLFLLLISIETAFARSLEFDTHLSSIKLHGHFAVLDAEPGTQVDHRALLTQPQNFKPHPGTPFWGFNIQPQWLLLTLENPANTPQERWLEIQPVFTDHLYLYWLDGQDELVEMKGGDLMSPRDRPFNLPAQLFPVKLEAGESRTLLFYVQGTNPLFVDATLWQPEAFMQHWQTSNSFMTAYLGILALMTGLGIFYSLFMRDRMFVFYAVYVATQLTFQLSHTGYFDWLFNPGWYRLADLLTSGAVSLSVVALAVVFNRLTRINLDYPLLARLHLFAAGSVAFTGLAFTLFDRYYFFASYLQLYALFGFSFTLGFSCWRLYQRRFLEGSIFIAMFGVLGVAVVLRILREQALLENSFLTENALYIGTLIHLVLMQVYIVWQIMLEKRRINQKLEQKVADRTQELQEHNQKLAREIEQNKLLQEQLSQSAEKIQERYEVEAQLRQEQQNFFQMVSHEFRTPLTAINGSLQILSMKCCGTQPEVTKWLSSIEGSANRLSSLVDSSLWEHRMNDGGFRITPQALDLLPWLIQVTENLRRMYQKPNILLDQQTPIKLHTDTDLLQMLLQHLVDNAVRFSSADQPVTLQVEAIDPSSVRISVIDQGPGVPEEMRQRLFNRYARMAHANKREGLGIGLYLSYHAAQKLGGSLSYSPASPGSCFTLILPVAQHLAAQPLCESDTQILK
ncbi:sensor histidine kinase [Marinospirillum alkaliphilum]|uniref:histidine kinase n=1 Tax=Marinospirillum alkaliphilum DSM 21637 TaxID=1122209 RepID=A0A1K1VY35_9GAMM|nr:sensor histidine kinase [Marinospirillum alkaliphilum]SFX29903.1 Signal transduction histidine kinase [Marinospirillum alkaliphilum DSM 21637]